MDAIVIGGGIGGLTLALALHGCGAVERYQKVAGYHVQQVSRN
jgi:2-polyprenyl-6-methoxyphenol hydroxylase-like FAD-dependent oxidoreductase